jgi:hypothetical protein
MNQPRSRRWRRLGLVAVALGAIALPSAARPAGEGLLPKVALAQLSAPVVTQYIAAHPDSGFGTVGSRLAAANKKPNRLQVGPAGCKSVQETGSSGPNQADVFNCDGLGLPQNEESIGVCTANRDVVLGGTNDYRGIVDPDGNFTGWHFSLDGGRTVTNEGLLPPVSSIKNPAQRVPSGGDPVDFIYADGTGCHTFAAGLAFTSSDPFDTTQSNGIAVYRSEPSILASCPGGPDPSCWPTRRLIAEGAAGHFLDKPWMTVGSQDDVPYVWVTWSDFDFTNSAVPFTASVKAARCDITLTTCIGPIAISTIDDDIQFSDVTVGPDGRAYITWSKISGELEGTPQTFTHKIRVETAPGSAVFGPEHVIYAENRAIPFGGFMQANDFRVATYPKSDVAWVNGHPRVFVVWEACAYRLFEQVCEYSEIKLSYSDDRGATWNGPYVISTGGVNYFPSISVDRADPATKKLSVAWYTNRYDAFNNAQDVVLAGVDTGQASYGPEASTRLTNPSNEPEADPLLGGFFIGDYMEVVQVGKRAWTHYNANYRQIPVLGLGLPVNQQDNYLSSDGVG